MVDIVKVKENLHKFGIYLILIVVSFLTGMGIAIYQYVSTQPDAKEIQLTEIKVAWVPETEQVYFIDRKTNKVTSTLSKEVTTAVFSLKASAIQTDFSQVTSGGVAPKRSYVNKNTSQPKSTQTAPK